MHADTEDCDFFGHVFFSLLDVFVGQGREKWGREKRVVKNGVVKNAANKNEALKLSR
jgi:acyl-CoA thioesterase FadM